MVRDSAGVSILVSLDSVWSAPEQWRLASTPDMQFGDVDNEPLYEVTAAAFLPSGGVAFTNSGTHELVAVDSTGRVRFRFGREGEGPGEFQGLDALQVARGDTLLVLDRGLSRASFISPTGEFYRALAMPRFNGAPLRQVFPLRDGRFIGSINSRGRVPRGPDAPTGFVRDHATHLLISAEGVVEDTIVVLPGDQQYYVPSGRTPDFMVSRNPMLRLSAVYAVSPVGELYAGLGDDFSIGVFGVDGSLRRVIRDSTVNLALSREEFDDHVDAYIARAKGRGDPGPPPGWTYDMPIPQRRPPFSAFLFDDEGNLWVSPYAEFNDWAKAWKVFDLGGRLLGSVGMPERFRPLAVAEQKVLGVRTTELNVEVVEIYSLLK